MNEEQRHWAEHLLAGDVKHESEMEEEGSTMPGTSAQNENKDFYIDRNKIDFLEKRIF